MGRAKKIIEEPKATSMELVVYSRKDGVLKTNATEILEFVKQKLVVYNTKEYSEANIAEAKRDKAELNSAVKLISSRRLDLEREFMKPFMTFKDTVALVCSDIKTVSDKIDKIVSDVEQKTKLEKREAIQNYFNSRGFDLITLDRIFRDQWLNKGTPIETIMQEIDDQISRIYKDLESLNEFGDEAKAMYLETLDLSSAIFKATELKQRREALQNAGMNKPEPRKPLELQVVDEPIVLPHDPIIPEKPRDVELVYRIIKVTCTMEQLQGLGRYLTDHGIQAEKIQGGIV